MSERTERLAENETVFRAGNEAIEANRRGAPDGGAGERLYLCECGSATCFEQISLTRAQYEAVRAHPARFLVARGHEDESAGEVVVADGPGYVVVEKAAAGRQIAEDTDPRDDA
jgi:hypothetical protein